MAEAQLYSCFDFRLRSDVPLGELNPACDADDPRPIVEVRLGELPDALPGGGEVCAGLQAAGEEALLTVGGAARYLIRGGREIVIDPDPRGTARKLRLFLLGSALGILCHQRGLLPLHANAIVFGTVACAFAGPSGAGKSTLAAYFARAGHPVLCDDVCVVSFDERARPLAWPGLPRLKLWGDASSAFGHDKSLLDPVEEGMDKYHVPLPAPGAARPVPLRRLYVLGRAQAGRESEFVRLRGGAALEAVMAQTYRGLYLETLGLTARHFRQCAALASSIEVYAANRAWGYELFEREADRLARHLLEDVRA